LVYQIKKRQILIIGCVLPILNFLAMAELLWECAAVTLATKLITAFALEEGVLIIRKLVARLLSGKTQTHVKASLPQKLNLATSVIVSILNYIFSDSVFLEVLNLLNWTIILSVAWYYYLYFVWKMKESFKAVRPSTGTEPCPQ
jgi:hypothetical protein